MFMHDQPVASDLTIPGGYAYCTIDWTTLHIGTLGVHEAVPESDVTFDRNAEINDGQFRYTFEAREEVFPTLAIGVSTTFLPWYDVENDETFVRYVVLHDRVNVPGVDGRRKFILQRPDRCFIVGYPYSCHILFLFSLCTTKELDSYK